MPRLIASAVLLSVALFMLLGFMQSGAALGAPATIAALLVAVALPAAGAAALLASHTGRARALAARRDKLRQQTLEAEVLRLAGARDGRVTVVEVVTELALTHEEAAAVLTSFDTRGVAEVQITPSGVLVYSFHDVRHLADKSAARGVLDA